MFARMTYGLAFLTVLASSPRDRSCDKLAVVNYDVAQGMLRDMLWARDAASLAKLMACLSPRVHCLHLAVVMYLQLESVLGKWWNVLVGSRVKSRDLPRIGCFVPATCL
jgi:hypothetical protein